VVKSPPDGHTLFIGNSATHGTNPTLYPNAAYDAMRDFAPVSRVGSVPIVLPVNSALPVRSIAELAAYEKSPPEHWASASTAPAICAAKP
jgi:tripartite-type tricarboxylate transporter receptor subunit TctC